MDIVVMVLDLMHAYNFSYQVVNGVKIWLLLVYTIVYHCMLIIEIIIS